MQGKQIFYTINKALLFACVSMYFGTGWSLVLFSFPTAHDLTPDTYYPQFVPQVQAATRFLTVMTVVMMVNCIILVIEEWKTKLKWFGIGVLLAVILATALTELYIFPYNVQMEAGIKTQEELDSLLGKWMRLNIVRVCIWTVQWLLMMIYFIVCLQRNSPKKSSHVS